MQSFAILCAMETPSLRTVKGKNLEHVGATEFTYSFAGELHQLYFKTFAVDAVSASATYCPD